MWLRIINHLLPRADAWTLAVGTQIRAYFQALVEGLGPDAKEYIDLVFRDIHPDTTRELDAWESQFNITNREGVTEDERREGLAAAWQALGGQDPRYLQDTLRAAGFDVYVYDWWDDDETHEQGGSVGGDTSPVARDPREYVRAEYVSSAVRAADGMDYMQCGEDNAMCGYSSNPIGYVLANKVASTSEVYSAADGEDGMQCGEATATCGYYSEVAVTYRNYIVPDDGDYWPYFAYIGGNTFGTVAQVSSSRREEFETLLLKIFPCHLWLAVMVEYV